MKPEDATTLLTMEPERVQLMIMYGYEGGTLWRCLNTLLKGYLSADEVDNAMVCLGYFYDKFSGIEFDAQKIIKVIRNVVQLCAECINSKDNEESAEGLLIELGKSDNDKINTCVDMLCAINSIGSTFDFEKIFKFAKENKCVTDFFNLL